MLRYARPRADSRVSVKYNKKIQVPVYLFLIVSA